MVEEDVCVGVFVCVDDRRRGAVPLGLGFKETTYLRSHGEKGWKRKSGRRREKRELQRKKEFEGNGRSRYQNRRVFWSRNG